MVMVKNHKVPLKKLKQQIQLLRKKEEQSRNKLRSALKKIRKLGKMYKNKLKSKVSSLQGKIAAAQVATYAKVATDLERKIQKSVVAKGKALTSAITQFEKKHMAKLTKDLAKKGSRKVGKISAKKTNTAKKIVKKRIKKHHKRGASK